MLLVAPRFRNNLFQARLDELEFRSSKNATHWLDYRLPVIAAMLPQSARIDQGGIFVAGC